MFMYSYCDMYMYMYIHVCPTVSEEAAPSGSRWCLCGAGDCESPWLLGSTCKTQGDSKARLSATFQRKRLSCLERDLNPRSFVYWAGALTTEPPRQLSRLG